MKKLFLILSMVLFVHITNSVSVEEVAQPSAAVAVQSLAPSPKIQSISQILLGQFKDWFNELIITDLGKVLAGLNLYIEIQKLMHENNKLLNIPANKEQKIKLTDLAINKFKEAQTSMLEAGVSQAQFLDLAQLITDTNEEKGFERTIKMLTTFRDWIRALPPAK